LFEGRQIGKRAEGEEQVYGQRKLRRERRWEEKWLFPQQTEFDEQTRQDDTRTHVGISGDL